MPVVQAQLCKEMTVELVAQLVQQTISLEEVVVVPGKSAQPVVTLLVVGVETELIGAQCGVLASVLVAGLVVEEEEASAIPKPLEPVVLEVVARAQLETIMEQPLRPIREAVEVELVVQPPINMVERAVLV